MGELNEWDYDHLMVFFDNDGPAVLRRCPECGRFLNKGEVFVNGLEETKLEGWICKKHGEVQPFYEYI